MVRFFAGADKELLPRKDQLFKVSQILPRMKAALTKAGKKSNILALAEPEIVRPSLVALSQHCFWTGELKIGGIPGVVATEAGWLEGREVTLVSYDKNTISEAEIVKRAKEVSCANKVFNGAALQGYLSLIHI